MASMDTAIRRITFKMDFLDYYTVLGVTDHATQASIKLAYRKLARKFHPDVSTEQNADARFKTLGAAYAVLKDTQKRIDYDQSLASQSAKRKLKRSADNVDPSTDSSAFKAFSRSAFDATKARSRGGCPPVDPVKTSRRRRGKDLHHRMALTLEEAVHGIQRTLTLKMPASTAPGCTQPIRTKTLIVTIPAGFTPGQRLRLFSQGAPGEEGGAPGDFFLNIDWVPHPLFTVSGRNIAVYLPVADWEVAIGAKVTVPTLAGSVSLTIPTGSTSGSKLRLKGRGLGVNPTGDLIVNLLVMEPERHWTKAEAMYREVAGM